MFVKVTHSGTRRYAQLVESFRNDAYFSDRGRLFQADRGRQKAVAEAALGKRAGTVLMVAQSSTSSLKQAVVGRVWGLGLNAT